MQVQVRAPNNRPKIPMARKMRGQKGGLEMKSICDPASEFLSGRRGHKTP
jgi:hypothetical protein